MGTTNAATWVAVYKVDRRKLITVATNMAPAGQLENPRRLSSLGDQVLLRNEGFFEGENEHKDNNRCKEEHNEHS